ncbi:MAG: zinc ribbon domain-containing protein [Bryobacterales bacterium]|nr:zinc ribbon domain-containing protein [Bryobacterales bacterium]
MPLYEYRCKQCERVFEVMQKFSDPALTVHEECGGEVEKLISPPAFQFKGSGWYITDYARSGGAKGESKKDKADSKSSGSSEKTSDSSSAKSDSSSSTTTTKAT